MSANRSDLEPGATEFSCKCGVTALWGPGANQTTVNRALRALVDAHARCENA